MISSTKKVKKKRLVGKKLSDLQEQELVLSVSEFLRNLHFASVTQLTDLLTLNWSCLSHED